MRWRGSSPPTSTSRWSAVATRESTSAARALVDREVSIGDYVLTGGELPALVVIDAVVRLVPGVIEDASIGVRLVRRRPAGAPAVHPTRGIRGELRAADPAVGSPRRGGSLAPARGAAPDPRATSRPAGVGRPATTRIDAGWRPSRGHSRLTRGWRRLAAVAGVGRTAILRRSRPSHRSRSSRPARAAGAAIADKPRLRPR